MSAGQLVRAAATRLVAAGFTKEDAARDAGVLLRHLLDWSLAEWLLRQQEDVDPELTGAFDRYIDRRLRREPVAYILGHREFFGRRFGVTPAVLIPRPETELLVEWALEIIDAHSEPGPCQVLDVGTGSGCVALSIALERPRAQVSATDISSAALDVARATATRLDRDSRVTWMHAPLTGGLSELDIIVSNPPYLADGDLLDLMPDVRDFEPSGALWGGPDGLDVVRALIVEAARALRPRGYLGIEVGMGQAETVRDHLAQAGWARIEVRNDLAGIDRVVTARRPADASL
jgi:release factor glutamine methyltransferase